MPRIRRIGSRTGRLLGRSWLGRHTQARQRRLIRFLGSAFDRNVRSGAAVGENENEPRALAGFRVFKPMGDDFFDENGASACDKTGNDQQKRGRNFIAYLKLWGTGVRVCNIKTHQSRL